MFSNHLVSVVIATYNGAKYIQEQLDSILQQSLHPDEIVVIDDASIDNTLELILDYQKQYSLIQIYVNKHNLGACRTFEMGIKYARGDYIALADQDDVWLPNKLEILLNSIGSALLVHSDAKLVDHNLEIIANSYHALKPNTDNQFSKLLAFNNVTGCTLLFSRKLKDLALPIPEPFKLHDYYLALIASYYKSIVYVGKPLIWYRQHQHNVVGGNLKTEFESYLKWEQEIYLSLRALQATLRFQNNLDLAYAISLHQAKAVAKCAPFKVYWWSLRTLGIKHFIKFVCATVGGIWTAKLLFKLSRQ